MKKCGIIEFKRMKKSRQIGEELNGVPNCTNIGYQYLGVKITRKFNYEDYIKGKRLKVWGIVSRIRKYVEGWSLNKKRLIVKSLIQPHLDYIGMLLQMGTEKEMEKFKASMRRFIRVIFGLGFNVKCKMVDLLVDVNREKIWLRRLRKIRDDWKEMAGFNWCSINKICDEANEVHCRELKVKEYNFEHQKQMIEIFNKFNRAFCKCHPERRLSTSHLKESHNIIMDYELIEESLKKNEWGKINEMIIMLRSLEKEEMIENEKENQEEEKNMKNESN